jgi:hypothetical protein
VGRVAAPLVSNQFKARFSVKLVALIISRSLLQTKLGSRTHQDGEILRQEIACLSKSSRSLHHRF